MNDHAELGQKFVETLRLYDPVCFDIGLRKNYDYRIVKIDHEEILCNQRIKVVPESAPSFRALVLQTIERASAVRKS